MLFEHLRTLPFVQLVYFNFPSYQLHHADADASGALTRDLRGYHHNNFGMLARFLALADLGHTAELVLLSDIDGTWSPQWKSKLDLMMERKALCLRCCDPDYRVDLWGGASAFAWYPHQSRPLCFDGIESSMHAFATWHMRYPALLRYLSGVGMHFQQHQIQEDRREIIAAMREELQHASNTGYALEWSDRKVEQVFKRMQMQDAPNAAEAGASPLAAAAAASSSSAAASAATAASAASASASQTQKRKGGKKQPKKKRAVAATAASSFADDAFAAAASDDDDSLDDAADPSCADDPVLDEFKGCFAYGADQLFLSTFVLPIVVAAVGMRESRCDSPQPGSLVNVFVRLPQESLDALPPRPPTPMLLASNPRSKPRPEFGKMLQAIKPIPADLTEDRVVWYVGRWIEEQQKKAAAAKLKAMAAGTKRKAAQSMVKKPAPTPSRLQPQRTTKRAAASSPCSDGGLAAPVSFADAAPFVSFPGDRSDAASSDFGDAANNGFQFDDGEEDEDRDSGEEDVEEEEEGDEQLDLSDEEWGTQDAKKKQRVDRPSSALSGSPSPSPHAPLIAPPAAARAAPAAESLLTVDRDAVQEICLWYPSAGASGAHRIRLLRVVHRHSHPASVFLYAHAVDVCGVVVARKNSAELISRFDSPSERLRFHVQGTQAHNILTAAGVRRLLSIRKMKQHHAYQQWIKDVLLRRMKEDDSQSDEEEQAESSELVGRIETAAASAAGHAPWSLDVGSAVMPPRRSRDEQKSRINPNPQPLSPVADWAAATMEEESQQQQQEIWEQQPHPPQSLAASSPVAAPAHSAPDLSSVAHTASTPMQLDDDELVDLTESPEPARSVPTPATPSASSISVVAAAAGAPLTPPRSPAVEALSRFTSPSPVSSPTMDITRAAAAASVAHLSDGECSDSSSMPPLSYPSVTPDSAARAASASTSSTTMSSRGIPFDLTPALENASASSSSAAAAVCRSPAAPVDLDLEEGEWDPSKPPPNLPSMKPVLPFAGDSEQVGILADQPITAASASLQFDALAPAAPSLKCELAPAGWGDMDDDEVGDVEDLSLADAAAAAAARKQPIEMIEISDDEEPVMTQSTMPPAAAASSPSRSTPSRISSRRSVAPSSAGGPAPAASSSSVAALPSRKSLPPSSASVSPESRWDQLDADKYADALVDWAPTVIEFVTINQPAKWSGPKIFAATALQLQQLFTDINVHQAGEGEGAGEVFAAKDIPTFAEKMWRRLHQ